MSRRGSGAMVRAAGVPSDNKSQRFVKDEIDERALGHALVEQVEQGKANPRIDVDGLYARGECELAVGR